MKRPVILNSGDIGFIALSVGFAVAMVVLATCCLVGVCMAAIWYPVSIGIAVLVYVLELARLCWRRVWE